MIIGATGSAAIHPTTSTRLRPWRSARCPAARLANALVMPNATRNANVADADATPKSRSASSGRTVRSIPTIAPTNALMTTSSVN
jgi:hypothetical protein